MGHHVRVTGFQTSSTAVADEVRRLRTKDPLARITVIVPSFGAARDLVRALALAGGAAGVAVRTAAQVVAELSAPALAPRAALPLPLLAAAVDKALDSDPGGLQAVATEPVTGQAVARACLRLGTVEPGSVTPVTPLHEEVLRLSQEALTRTGTAYYTQFEAVSTALERLGSLGSVIVAARCAGPSSSGGCGRRSRPAGWRRSRAPGRTTWPPPRNRPPGTR